jgi:rod shape-determining protein MreC
MNQTTVPVLGFSQGFFRRVDDFFEVFLNLWKIQDENKDLKQELGKLRLEVDRLKYLSRENERLVKLLDFVKQSPWTVLPSRVIGRAPSLWNQSVWIDRGLLHGLQVGMGAVNADGIVGKVVEVLPESSRVLLLIDESCKVGAMVEESQEMGILQGGRFGKGFILNYLPRDAKAKVGDHVLSSGLSKFFPSGAHIGTISKVQDDDYGLFQFAEVKPNVRFGELEEVLVIVSQEKLSDE